MQIIDNISSRGYECLFLSQVTAKKVYTILSLTLGLILFTPLAAVDFNPTASPYLFTLTGSETHGTFSVGVVGNTITPQALPILSQALIYKVSTTTISSITLTSYTNPQTWQILLNTTVIGGLNVTLNSNGTFQNSGINNGTGTFVATPIIVPEPATMILLGSLCSAVVGYKYKRKQSLGN